MAVLGALIVTSAALAQLAARDVLLQSAAGGNGNGTAANTTGYTLIGVQVTNPSGTPTFTVNFESSVDGSTYVATVCRPVGGGVLVTTTTTTGAWRCNVSGAKNFRGRISGYSGTGTITVVASVIQSGLVDTGENVPDGSQTVNQGGVWTIQAAHQAGVWNLNHVSSVTHMAAASPLPVVQSSSGPLWNVTAHQGGVWNVNHVSSTTHAVVTRSMSGSGGNQVCHSQATFVTSADAIVAHGAAGVRLYVCGLFLTFSTVTVSVVEGTGAACVTSPSALLGSTTATNGVAAGTYQMVASQPWLSTQTNGNQICVLTTASTSRVVGTIVYGAY